MDPDKKCSLPVNIGDIIILIDSDQNLNILFSIDNEIFPDFTSLKASCGP